MSENSDEKKKKGKGIMLLLFFASNGIPIAIAIFIIGFLLVSMIVITSVVTHEEVEESDSGGDGNVGKLEGDIEHLDLINEKASKHDVSPALIAAVMKQESNFDSDVESPVGAMGLMQIMPENCKGHGYTIDECKEDENNVDIGAKMISEHMDDYDDDMELALAAYNAGVGNVQKYDGVPPFEETENYVKDIPEYYEEFKEDEKDGELEESDDGFDGEGEGEFSYPVKDGKENITSPFGGRWGKQHAGIDIGKPFGDNIYASDNGKVVLTKSNPGGYGYYVDIEHEDGWITRYGHMYKDTVEVEEGDKVKQGDKIAEVGSNGHSTGPHLHFEIQKEGGEPVDPEKKL